MTESDDLVARLRALGSHPVDPAVASEHLTAMASVRTGRARPVGRFQRLKIAAAFGAGIVLGGTSLASAGVMGENVRNTVADAAQHVGVNLPGGTPRYGVGAAECPGYTAGTNHGQWVKAHKGDPGAAKSDCGKPLHSVDKAKNDGNENDAGQNGNAAACKPPWAGKGKAAKDAKAASRNWQPPAGCENDQGEQDSETTGTAKNDVEPSSTTPSSVTPPSTPDTNAGVPDGGSVPGQNEQGDEHRDGATATTRPPEANANATRGGDNGDQRRQGAGTSTTTPLP